MIAHPTPDPRARLEALRGVVDPWRERLRGQNGIPLTPEETRRVYEDVRDLQARPEGLDPDHRAWVEEIWRDTAMFWVESISAATRSWRSWTGSGSSTSNQRRASRPPP